MRALCASYEDRRLIGKLGSNLNEPYRDIGLGVRQGKIDSADAFAAFIDDLDAEIERAEEKLGRKLGIPFVGNGEREKDTLTALKHADDTCTMATTEEDLQILIDVLTIWCQKWQLTPQALKCDIVVFENSGFTKPELNFARPTLPVKCEVVYLGYLLNYRGN